MILREVSISNDLKYLNIIYACFIEFSFLPNCLNLTSPTQSRHYNGDGALFPPNLGVHKREQKEKFYATIICHFDSLSRVASHHLDDLDLLSF